MRNLHTIIFFLLVSLSAKAQETLSLEECYSLASSSYPIARQTGLLQNRSDLEITASEKARLPKVDLNAQATYQSEVIEFPLPNSAIAPLNKDQYRATLDLSQLIYDGGTIRANTNLKKAELQVQQQQVAVNLYPLKSRINQFFFSILLLQEQQALLSSKEEQLQAQIDEVKTGVRFGAILPASENVLEAEELNIKQQRTQLNFEREKALANLSYLVNKKLPENVILIDPELPAMSAGRSSRPELQLFDLQHQQIGFSKELISKSILPKVNGFVQAGYGNPGLNMLDNSFHDFYMFGVKATWNVFDWGKTRASKKAMSLSQEIIQTEKETFQLNNDMQAKEAGAEIDKIEELLVSDKEIILLREKVLKSAASQLRNGVITSSQYLTEFNNLYQSKINQKLHEIQLNLAKANYNVIKGKTNNQ